jgi:hypothetical protein
MVRIVGPLPSRLDGFFRWMSWDQADAPTANQVLPAQDLAATSQFRGTPSTPHIRQ